MQIRKYKSIDLDQIVRLFYDTVHTVNIKDYSTQQVNVWATRTVDLDKWDKSFREHISYVAVEN